MSEAAHYSVRDGIAVITLNNPPVNGLGNALRAAVMEHLKKADADAAVKAVVIIGSAKFFSGGADIREFSATRLPPDLPEVNDAAGRDAASRWSRRSAASRSAAASSSRSACHFRVAAAEIAARAARGQARHPARLGRHAAPAAHHPDGRGGAHDDHRRHDLRRRRRRSTA